MNLSTLKSLAVYLLLTICFSCQKDIDPVPNLVNCRIVKETQWAERGRFTDQSETIVVESKQLVIHPQSIVTYTYDRQGRIIREDPDPADNGEVYWTTYVYGQNGIIKTQRVMADPNDASKGVKDYTTIIPLNEGGLDARKHYDTEGYAIDSLETKGLTKLVRRGGNVVSMTSYYMFGNPYSESVSFAYDTTRLSLPNMYPFQGRGNKNLSTQTIGFYPVALISHPRQKELYRINHYYTFDNYGRVTRMIRAYHADEFQGILFNGQIDITDYEYDCP